MRNVRFVKYINDLAKESFEIQVPDGVRIRYTIFRTTYRMLLVSKPKANIWLPWLFANVEFTYASDKSTKWEDVRVQYRFTSMCSWHSQEYNFYLLRKFLVDTDSKSESPLKS